MQEREQLDGGTRRIARQRLPTVYREVRIVMVHSGHNLNQDKRETDLRQRWAPSCTARRPPPPTACACVQRLVAKPSHLPAPAHLQCKPQRRRRKEEGGWRKMDDEVNCGGGALSWEPAPFKCTPHPAPAVVLTHPAIEAHVCPPPTYWYHLRCMRTRIAMRTCARMGVRDQGARVVSLGARAIPSRFEKIPI